MAKFNRTVTGAGARDVITSTPAGRTFEGGAGHAKDQKGEFFSLVVNLMGGDEKTFYESGKARDSRAEKLAAEIAVADPTWILGCLPWVRNTANMRTAPLMCTAAAVHSRLSDKESVRQDELLSSLGHMGVNRALVGSVPQRADEPGEYVALVQKKYGKLSKPERRGLADAANRLYNSYSVMKYDTSSHAVRFADVLNLTHATPTFDPPKWQIDKVWDDPEQDELKFMTDGALDKVNLFSHIVNRRFGNVEDTAFLPSMISTNMAVRKEVAKGNYDVLLNADVMKAAGFTWEDVLSMAGSKVDKAKLWESIIPSMGVFALARNLRNFEEAGISKEMREFVVAKLSDPKVIAKSRMFPFRWLSAYEAVNGVHYVSALEDAVNLSTQNIPSDLDDSLICVDLSQSMQSGVSGRSTMTMAKQAALFGAAIALKNPGAKLVAFASRDQVISVPRGGSILKIASEMDEMSRRGTIGGGTETGAAIQNHFKNHKRVIVITDGQSFPISSYGRNSGGYFYGYQRDLRSLVNDKTYMYGVNLAGYAVTDIAAGQGRTYELPGLSDAMFQKIPLLERGTEQRWPWQVER